MRSALTPSTLIRTLRCSPGLGPAGAFGAGVAQAEPRCFGVGSEWSQLVERVGDSHCFVRSEIESLECGIDHDFRSFESAGVTDPVRDEGAQLCDRFVFVAGWGLEGQAAGSGVSATAGGDSFVDRLGNARPEIEAQG